MIWKRQPVKIQVGHDDELVGPEELVQRETNVVNALRATVIALLVVVGVLLSFWSYRLTSEAEKATYQKDFDAISLRFTELFLTAVSQAMWNGYAVAVSATANSELLKAAPSISLPTLATLATGVQRTARVSGVFWSPLIRNEDKRQEWEAYANSEIQNQSATSDAAVGECFPCGTPYLEIGSPQGVVVTPIGNYKCADVETGTKFGLVRADECPYLVSYVLKSCQCRPAVDIQNNTRPYDATRAPRLNKVYKIDGNTDVIPVDNSGPFSPIWQVLPSGEWASWAMFDLFSDDLSRRALALMLKSRQAELTEVADSAAPNLWSKLLGYAPDNSGRHSLMFTPVFDRQESGSRIIGSIVFDIDWAYLLGANLPLRSSGIQLVLESMSGQSTTFRCDGNSIALVGKGDLHDPAYSSMMRQSTFDDYFALQSDKRIMATSNTTGRNAFRISVYSSNEFRHNYITNKPWVYVASVMLTFVFTTGVFIAYSCFVARRQRKIMIAALQRDEIVSALFPAGVRGRLFSTSQNVTPSSSRFGTKQLLHGVNPKAQLRRMLNSSATSTNLSLPPTEPIADLFPSVTVVFVDISGFTAWSSEREPSQVFKLLETVYQAFDKLAKRFGVFKIETIGDCYVAVAGLPVYQPDHAVRVVKFAYHCILRMDELTHELESTLGPSTSNLSIRVGAHSGPVIAGVLRGEKSRFQLFGDTMNTTSRIQTTGEINMIQISGATAHHLQEAGKGQWIREREEPVEMKGKGLVQTFWVDPVISDEDGDDGLAVDETRATPTNQPSGVSPESRIASRLVSKTFAESDKVKRLIEWNTDLLLRYLKTVVAARQKGKRSYPDIWDSECFLHRNQTKGKHSSIIRATKRHSRHSDMETDVKQSQSISTIPLKEATEAICMPDFSEKAAKVKFHGVCCDVDTKIRTQLLEYVTAIASKYRNNPFHNFEHASHVVMSASKVVTRIITPDLDDHESYANNKGQVRLKQKIHDSTFGISSDALMQFAVVFSALIHDVDHSGVPNAQLVKESVEVACRYDNKCVAEQNSVDIAWNLLLREEYQDLLRCICPSQDERQRFRQLLVNAVIATDIADKQLQRERKIRWDKAFHPESDDPDLTVDCKSNMDRKATIVFEYIIQASDVAHTMQHWKVYKKWNEKLLEERYLSYINGREEEDPSIGWYQGEIQFFDNYIIPLAKKLETCGVFGVSSDEYLSYALENRHEWRMKGDEIVQSVINKYQVEKRQSYKYDADSDDEAEWCFPVEPV